MLHRWRKAGEASHLWSWVHLPRVEDQRAGELAVEMLKSVRLAKVEKVSISVEFCRKICFKLCSTTKG